MVNWNVFTTNVSSFTILADIISTVNTYEVLLMASKQTTLYTSFH